MKLLHGVVHPLAKVGFIRLARNEITLQLEHTETNLPEGIEKTFGDFAVLTGRDDAGDRLFGRLNHLCEA